MRPKASLHVKRRAWLARGLFVYGLVFGSLALLMFGVLLGMGACAGFLGYP